MCNRVLVTGGAGFIGSHLCERLINEGHDVVAVDNFFTGRKTNLTDLLNQIQFKLIEHDVIEPVNIEADQIYNLACPASPVHYQRDPIQTLKTSMFGTFNLLELAKRENARILQASTSEVYGDPEEHPQIENYWGHVNPVGSRSCYDEGKRVAESLFFEYRRQFGMNAKIVRIFNTYGPRMDPEDGRVVSNFIVQALKNENITVYGEGNQTRSFCYITDLVEGLVKMMNTVTALGPLNIGNPAEYTILELAEKIIKLTGSKSKLVFKALPQDDPQRRQPDIKLAKDSLGWEPKVPLDDGLRETIAYFRKINL